MFLSAGVEKQSGFGDKGGSPPLSPAGNAVEASPRGEPLKCGVKNVRGVIDDFGCLSKDLLAENMCQSSDRQARHSQISPSQPLIAVAGDDVVLPCQLEPPVDAVQMTIEWGKPALNPRFVFVRHNGQELQTDQNTAYKGRVTLSIDKLKHGDVSLNLSKVKVSDSGRYRCYIPQQSKEYFVELLVGASSQPDAKLAGLDKASSGVMLDCKSAGWYPEPEVIWMDGDGNLLSAGHTEALRGPDDLYTVSSRVTVEKRQNNNITCRVQQKNINQSRETHIHVPDDFFVAPASCVVPVTFNVIFCFIFVLAVAIFMWKNKMKVPTTECQTFLEDLGNKNGKLDEELKAWERNDVDDCVHMCLHFP
ncbi:butyrophilin subfamily 1 member A1-like [Pelmatolapia mariae]|uniref:butyrophilin subfamily 1 member A1-like n=1 Tax=Pelmatolapia mariae TaxID=158779 RepID=UPI003211D6E4